MPPHSSPAIGSHPEPPANSFQVNVYAGVVPMTGKRIYLSESTTDEMEAQRILNRLLVKVDKEQQARTKANRTATARPVADEVAVR